MLKSFRRFLRSVLTYVPSTRRARLEERITPEQVRAALEQMLADPHHRRALVHTLIGAATGVQGGTTVPAQDVCPGAFGANCAPGDYTLAGKLGIGTTPPSDKLEVLQGSAGRVVLGGAGDSFGPGVARGYVGLNINWNPATNDFTARGDGANNGGAIVFGDIFGNTYVAAIPSSGGGNQTVSPATLLSNTRLFVNGAGGFVQFSSNDGIALNQRVSNVALPYGLWRLIASGAHYWIQENTAPGGDFSSARTVMMLQSGGNVAIGPAAPQRRLHVQGGANDDYQLRLEAAAGRAVALEMFEGSTSRGLIAAGANSLDIYNGDIAGGPRISVRQTTGNVGIGATDRLAKFTVKGRAAFAVTGVVYTNAGLPVVTGSGTKFVTEVGLGDRITIGSEIKTVASIPNDTTLTTDSNYIAGYSGVAMTVLPAILRADDGSGNIQFIVSGDGRTNLNQMIFLKPLGGGLDDASQINNAIDALPADGGIITLLPGAEYRIQSSIVIARSGIKIRGYRGAWPEISQPAARLRWYGSDGGTVISISPTSGDQTVSDLELTDLNTYGGATGVAGVGAGLGILLDQVRNSRFINVHVSDMRKAVRTGETLTTPGGIGIKMDTTRDENCNWNYFENCSIFRVSQGLVMDASSAGPVNAAHNTFVGLSIQFYGSDQDDAGILLLECDNNAFYRTWMDRIADPPSGGYGVKVDLSRPVNPNPQDDVAGIYFYHLQASVGGYFVKTLPAGSTAPQNISVIFGYDLGNGQPIPASGPDTDITKFLAYMDSHGVIKGFHP